MGNDICCPRREEVIRITPSDEGDSVNDEMSGVRVAGVSAVGSGGAGLSRVLVFQNLASGDVVVLDPRGPEDARVISTMRGSPNQWKQLRAKQAMLSERQSPHRRGDPASAAKGTFGTGGQEHDLPPRIILSTSQARTATDRSGGPGGRADAWSRTNSKSAAALGESCAQGAAESGKHAPLAENAESIAYRIRKVNAAVEKVLKTQMRVAVMRFETLTKEHLQCYHLLHATQRISQDTAHWENKLKSIISELQLRVAALQLKINGRAREKAREAQHTEARQSRGGGGGKAESQGADYNDITYENLLQQLLDAEKLVKKRLGLLKKLSAPKSRTNLKISDFDLLKKIAEGGSSQVWLARHSGTQELFAIKDMNRERIARDNMSRRISQERAILALLSKRSPYVVQLYCSFRDEQSLYMVMEFVNGGDMYSLLQDKGRLSVQDARQYIGEVLLAVEFLHSNRVVHRDIKPDNMLITAQGHIKIGDFGLSHILDEEDGGPDAEQRASGSADSSPARSSGRQAAAGASHRWSGASEADEDRDRSSLHRAALRGSNGRSLAMTSHTHTQDMNIFSRSFQPVKEAGFMYSAVGTYNFLAPEVIDGIRQDHTVDWWSVAVVLFHMLTGRYPFNPCDGDVDKLLDNIVTVTILWPAQQPPPSAGVPEEVARLIREEEPLDPLARDLIEKVLRSCPSERLGAGGAAELRSHPFFDGVTWEDLHLQDPPFLPEVENEHDTSNFVDSRAEIAEMRRRLASAESAAPVDAAHDSFGAGAGEEKASDGDPDGGHGRGRRRADLSAQVRPSAGEDGALVAGAAAGADDGRGGGFMGATTDDEEYTNTTDFNHFSYVNNNTTKGRWFRKGTGGFLGLESSRGSRG